MLQCPDYFVPKVALRNAYCACMYYCRYTKIHTAFCVGAKLEPERRDVGRVAPRAFGDNDVIIISYDCRVESQRYPLCSLGLRVAAGSHD